MKIIKFFTVKKITYVALLLGAISLYLIGSSLLSIQKISKFNNLVSEGKSSKLFAQSFESRFSTAYWLAKNEMFKESRILFNNLLDEATNSQKSAVQYNLGNIFFKKALIVNGPGMNVRDEADYLFRQAKKSYIASLKHDHKHWDAKHNLDRLLRMIGEDPAPGVGDSDSPGLIMGNIPVGLP